MDAINVNVKKTKIRASRERRGFVDSQEAGSAINIGDNLFTLMLIGIAALGIWAITAVAFF